MLILNLCLYRRALVNNVAWRDRRIYAITNMSRATRRARPVTKLNSPAHSWITLVVPLASRKICLNQLHTACHTCQSAYVLGRPWAAYASHERPRWQYIHNVYKQSYNAFYDNVRYHQNNTSLHMGNWQSTQNTYLLSADFSKGLGELMR